MTVSTPVFFSIWVAAFLAWFPLAYQYRSEWKSQLQEIGGEIRSYNARNGYDQSVSREALARDIRNPFRNEDIREFAENNHCNPEEYEKELEQVLENPQRLFWAVSLHFLTLILILSGFTYFAPWGVIPVIVYLPLLYILLGFSVAFLFTNSKPNYIGWSH